MARGTLTDTIQSISKNFLNRKITVRELRLYPYIDFVMKNGKRLDPRKINGEEEQILSILNEEGHLSGGAGEKLHITKPFYDFMQEVLYISYVLEEGEKYQRVDEPIEPDVNIIILE